MRLRLTFRTHPVAWPVFVCFLFLGGGFRFWPQAYVHVVFHLLAIFVLHFMPPVPRFAMLFLKLRCISHC